MNKKTGSKKTFGGRGLKVVCEELMGLTLKNRPLTVLRKSARGCVNQIGDPKKDYHFVAFRFGKRTKDEFVVSPEVGLKIFQRGRARERS